MDNEESEKASNNNYYDNNSYNNYYDKNSFNNSYNNCYINNNPINNISSHNNSNYDDNNSKYYLKKTKEKKTKICNLDDPRLIKAYNEGYYGVNNIPKQYYIYPKFSNIEQNSKIKINNKKQSLNNNNLFDLNNKDNNFNNIYINKNNLNNNNNLSSYINYPYPKLINISSNYFSQFHFPNSNNNLNNNVNNNDNLKNKNDIFNKQLDISLKIKDDKNIAFKGSGTIINISKQKDITDIENNINKKEINLNNNDDDDEFDNGNFYYINNNITKRSVPYTNIPDNISIDDEEDE